MITIVAYMHTLPITKQYYYNGERWLMRSENNGKFERLRDNWKKTSYLVGQNNFEVQISKSPAIIRYQNGSSFRLFYISSQ